MSTGFARIQLAVIAAVLLVAPAAHAARPIELLPDFVQVTPSDVGVVKSKDDGHWRLGFTSAVENHGFGDFRIEARRASTADPTMSADQLVRRSDGSWRRYRAISYTFFYPPHNHWHLADFDHFYLKRASDGADIAPDRKQGFCVGDRYNRGPEGQPREPLPLGTSGPFSPVVCEKRNPQALSVSEGMSPGYGDDYDPQAEGQYIDITGVAAGRYYLVHITNANCRLRELDSANDAAAILIDLTWQPDGTPVVTPSPDHVDAHRFAPCPKPAKPIRHPRFPLLTVTKRCQDPSGCPGGEHRAPVDSGQARIPVRCISPSGDTCNGRVTLELTSSRGGRSRRQVLGSRRVSIGSAHATTLNVRLNNAGRQRTSKASGVTVTLRQTMRSAAGKPVANSQTLVLTGSRALRSGRLPAASAAATPFVCLL